MMETTIHITEEDRAAMDADQLDRWQAPLPEPFNFLNGLLNEVIDDVLLTASITEGVRRAADTKPVPDGEEGAELLPPSATRALPAVLENMGPQSIMAPVAEGVYAVAMAGGGLFLWDAGGGSEPQQLGEACAGLVPCQLQCTQLPPSTGPPSRRRLMLLSATPPTPPAEGEAKPEDAPAAGAEDAQLLVFDLTSPNVHDLDVTQAWIVAPVANVRLAALAPASATLSVDGRFAACVLHDGCVAVYHLPLPTPTPTPADKSGKHGEAPAAAPQAVGEPQLIMTTEALAEVGKSVSMHFMLAPAPRSVGEPLSWSACGIFLWGENSPYLHQRMLPSRSALALGGEAAMADPKEKLDWRLPGILTASAVSADSVMLATGLDEGSTVLWDTNVRSHRYVLQRHLAPVTKIALLGATLLASYASDHTLHGYDISPDPETGQGKLVFRRRLDESVAVRWLTISQPLPFVLVGCDDAVRVLDIHGDLLAKLSPSFPMRNPGVDEPLPPPMPREMFVSQPGPCALFPAARHLSIVCVSKPPPSATVDVSAEAPAEGDAPEAAEPVAADAAAAEEVPTLFEAGGGSEALSARLDCFSLVDVFIQTYPHISPLLGVEDKNTANTIRALLREYKHEQRQDAALMASLPLLTPASNLRSGGTPGANSRQASRRGVGSRASSVRGSSKALNKPGTAATLPGVPEDDAMLQSSRVSSVRGGGSILGSEAPGGKKGGLSEQMLMERQGMGPSGISSGAGSTIDRSQLPTRQRSVGGGSSISGGEGGGGGADRRSIDGGQRSIAGSAISSVGTAMSDANPGEPPFVDQVAKMQRLQRQRLHGRFQREARVARRWEELKQMASTMMQQEHQAQQKTR